jgi:hypothetical protein
MINLSSTTPVAPAGGTNVLWQTDASGDVSAYVPLGGLGTKTTVAPVSGVVTIDASVGSSFLITVNAAITSMSLVNGTDGQEITLLWAQDSTGHAVATSTFLLGSYSITTAANKHSCYKFTYNAGDNNWYQIGANNM